MKIIADSSIFLAVALDEPERAGVVELTRGHALVAPEILPFEIGNALSSMVKRKVLDLAQAVAVWDAIQRVPVEMKPAEIKSALRLACRHGIYAYDAYFLECASSLRAPLLTLDKGMLRIAHELGIQVLELAK